MNQLNTPASPCLSLAPVKRAYRFAAVMAAAGLSLIAATGAYAQVSTINSVIVQPRVIDDLPNAVLTAITNYPSIISFTETNAGTTNTAFSPIQDLWQFAVSGQTNAYVFQSTDYFSVSMDVTLTGSPIAPRKEAGFAFNDIGGNINGQYILDTDGHEVVAFGGNLPFYASPLTGTFQSGETIRMGITIFLDSNGNQAIIYSANGDYSPVLEFGSPQEDYTLGGYFQLQGQNTPSTNSGSAVFQDISIAPQPTLNIAANGSQTVIYWTGGATNYTLQSSTNLSTTNWAAVTNATPITGVAVTNATTPTFYRLVAP